VQFKESSIPTPVSSDIVREVVMLYGHVIRMFTGDNGYVLIKELESLSIPKEVTFSVSQADLSH